MEPPTSHDGTSGQLCRTATRCRERRLAGGITSEYIVIRPRELPATCLVIQPPSREVQFGYYSGGFPDVTKTHISDWLTSTWPELANLRF